MARGPNHEGHNQGSGQGKGNRRPGAGRAARFKWRITSCGNPVIRQGYPNLSLFLKEVTMSQSVEPPILPEDSPDRGVNCEVALEAAFADLVTASEAQGWTPQETAATLLKIATEHARQIEAAAAEVPTEEGEPKTAALSKDNGDKIQIAKFTPKVDKP